MSDDFTIVDCCVCPILWRLQKWAYDSNNKATKPLLSYRDRLFEREWLWIVFQKKDMMRLR